MSSLCANSCKTTFVPRPGWRASKRAASHAIITGPPKNACPSTSMRSSDIRPCGVRCARSSRTADGCTRIVLTLRYASAGSSSTSSAACAAMVTMISSVSSKPCAASQSLSAMRSSAIASRRCCSSASSHANIRTRCSTIDRQAAGKPPVPSGEPSIVRRRRNITALYRIARATFLALDAGLSRLVLRANRPLRGGSPRGEPALVRLRTRLDVDGIADETGEVWSAMRRAAGHVAPPG
ncbi:unannotated protein [freshwater metagenome]|uniref:Unannotated protein n=1 Tax=freshwater metagenome TaxID=449393 RepID=A0A6J6Z3D2_9ZZZZ